MDLSSFTRPTFSCALVFLLCGCSPDLTLPRDARIQCDGKGQCPKGYLCSIALKRCVSETTGSLCGDGIVVEGELCDDGNNDSGDGCSSDCRSDETCGNAIVDTEIGEECDCGDGTHTPSTIQSCTGPNADTPEASCRTTCRRPGCGDGIITPPEECEGNNLAEASCTDVDHYGGILGCTEFCRFDTSGCTGSCGDDEINGPEQCDGTDWVNQPSGTGSDLLAVYGTGPSDVFAGGANGTLLHYNGDRWWPMKPQLSERIHGIWADTKTVFLAGTTTVQVLMRTSNDTCQPAEEVTCGTRRTFSRLGSESDFASYPCSTRVLRGPEKYVRFIAPVSTTVTVRVENLDALNGTDLDVVVLPDTGHDKCDLETVRIASSGMVGVVDEQLSFQTTAGDVYFIVVDSLTYSNSQFVLDIECSGYE